MSNRCGEERRHQQGQRVKVTRGDKSELYDPLCQLGQGCVEQSRVHDGNVQIEGTPWVSLADCSFIGLAHIQGNQV